MLICKVLHINYIFYKGVFDCKKVQKKKNKKKYFRFCPTFDMLYLNICTQQNAKNKHLCCNLFWVNVKCGECGGSVVECRTPEREVRGSRPTSAVLCP